MSITLNSHPLLNLSVFYGFIMEDIMIKTRTYTKVYLYGDMVHKKRISKNLTEEVLAEICDISDRELRNIEAGRVVPKLDTAIKLAYALDMDFGELNVLIQKKENMSKLKFFWIKNNIWLMRADIADAVYEFFTTINKYKHTIKLLP